MGRESEVCCTKNRTSVGKLFLVPRRLGGYYRIWWATGTSSLTIPTRGARKRVRLGPYVADD